MFVLLGTMCSWNSWIHKIHPFHPIGPIFPLLPLFQIFQIFPICPIRTDSHKIAQIRSKLHNVAQICSKLRKVAKIHTKSLKVAHRYVPTTYTLIEILLKKVRPLIKTGMVQFADQTFTTLYLLIFCSKKCDMKSVTHELHWIEELIDC